MKSKEELIIGFNTGSLNQMELQRLEQLIGQGTVELDQLEDYNILLDNFMEPEDVSATIRSEERFSRLLKDYKNETDQSNRSHSYKRTFLDFGKYGIAASFALLIFWTGLKVGNKDVLNPPLSDPNDRSMAASILATEDISSRIHLINSAELNTADNLVIDALLFTLSNDESNNVRLACIDVLMEYSYLPEVRTGLIKSIRHQNAAVVLSNLAEAIGASGKKIDKEEFFNHIRNDLPPFRQEQLNNDVETIMQQL